jgi:hypothetical protein
MRHLYVNQLLITRDWRQVCNDEAYTASEILVLIVDYRLDEDIIQALCLRYYTHEWQQ